MVMWFFMVIGCVYSHLFIAPLYRKFLECRIYILVLTLEAWPLNDFTIVIIIIHHIFLLLLSLLGRWVTWVNTKPGSVTTGILTLLVQKSMIVVPDESTALYQVLKIKLFFSETCKILLCAKKCKKNNKG